MTMARLSLRTELRVWYGVVGAPAAWTVQHVLGYGVTEAACGPAGRQWGVPIATWSAVAMGVAVAIALGGLLAAFSVFRATESEAPAPEGRRHFLGVVGMTVSPLFACIILMSGIGSIVLDTCQQS